MEEIRIFLLTIFEKTDFSESLCAYEKAGGKNLV
mgnify:CR=1 FL=1